MLCFLHDRKRVRCVNPIQMSLFLPFRNDTLVGLGGGRARSPGVAQRPTAARNADGLNRSRYLPSGRDPLGS
jgi:hypothetical protein